METASHHQFGNHDKRLISILEILGSYFVDVYYNHVYNSARTSLKSGGSLTDEYFRRVQSYIVGVKTDEKCYRQVVQNLHKYFQTTTRHTALSFTDFVERIVQQFIPPEYYNLLKSSQKDEALESVIADLVSGLGAYVTSSDLIRQIIDEHDQNPRATIRMIQDHGIAVLLAKRGGIHNSFLSRIGQAKNAVSIDVIENFKKAIRKLVKQKTTLKTQLGETEERVLELEDEVKKYKARETKFRKLIKRVLTEQTQGQPAAAYAAAIPPRNTHAELDPLDFGQRDGLRLPEVPLPDRLAEPVDDGVSISRLGAGARSASFFATAAPEALARGAAAASKDRALAARGSDSVPTDRPVRRAANISALMADTRDDSSDDHDEGEDE